MSGVTITFGDQAENHVGMQIIGTAAARGLTVAELRAAQTRFESEGVTCEYIDLAEHGQAAFGSLVLPEAGLLIVRQGVTHLLAKEGRMLTELEQEQTREDVDKKALMYGREVNKKARHNLCFASEAQEPNYAAGQGRIVAFAEVPLTTLVRTALPEYFGPLTQDLAAEGNYYYDLRKCYIGFHGDAERKIVVAMRLRGEFPLYYQWYIQSKPVGSRLTLSLQSGDLYAMSAKAVGTDWRLKKVPTLRHAAGTVK